MQVDTATGQQNRYLSVSKVAARCLSGIFATEFADPSAVSTGESFRSEGWVGEQGMPGTRLMFLESEQNTKRLLVPVREQDAAPVSTAQHNTVVGPVACQHKQPRPSPPWKAAHPHKDPHLRHKEWHLEAAGGKATGEGPARTCSFKLYVRCMILTYDGLLHVRPLRWTLRGTGTITAFASQSNKRTLNSKGNYLESISAKCEMRFRPRQCRCL
ncbi:hypothetical protein BDZ91DRAFT_161096 [Kalaharituber pfeilii]|nr:hypothetical protein BDZ91DRAFT_161096 [Kalaharituber pfeilii]